MWHTRAWHYRPWHYSQFHTGAGNVGMGGMLPIMRMLSPGSMLAR